MFVKKDGYIKKRLDAVMPILQKVALGDFSESIPIPEKEDEFTAHFIALNLVIDDLRDLFEENKKQSKKLASEVAKRTKDLQEKIEELGKTNKVMIGRELKMAEFKERIESLEEKLKNKK